MDKKIDDLEDIPPVVIQKIRDEEDDEARDHSDNPEITGDIRLDHTNRPPRPSDYVAIQDYLRSLNGLKRYIFEDRKLF